MKSEKTKTLLICAMIGIGTLAAMKLLAADKTAPGAAGAAKWEHLALTHNLVTESANANLGRQINQLGRDGWEMVTVANISESGTTTKTVFYFKRPL